MLQYGRLVGHLLEIQHLQMSIVQTFTKPRIGHKGGKSLVLLPVLVFENVQQSAKQKLTPDFRKSCRLRSKPFAITTFRVQW